MPLLVGKQCNAKRKERQKAMRLENSKKKRLKNNKNSLLFIAEWHFTCSKIACEFLFSLLENQELDIKRKEEKKKQRNTTRSIKSLNVCLNICLCSFPYLYSDASTVRCVCFNFSECVWIIHTFRQTCTGEKKHVLKCVEFENVEIREKRLGKY